MNKCTESMVGRIAGEIGVLRDIVRHRLKQGMTYEEIRLLGAAPMGILTRRDITASARHSGVPREILLYRVAVLGWSLSEAEEYGSQAHPLPPDGAQIYLWKEEPLPPAAKEVRPAYIPPSKGRIAGGTTFKLGPKK